MKYENVFNEVIRVLDSLGIPYIQDKEFMQPALKKKEKGPDGIISEVYVVAFMVSVKILGEHYMYFAFVDPSTLKVMFLMTPSKWMFLDYDKNGNVKRRE